MELDLFTAFKKLIARKPFQKRLERKFKQRGGRQIITSLFKKGLSENNVEA
ncbi:hypothetical protein [Methanosarcina sp. UBA289]|uniref:hypothetical protein n=1 Tax=Methanosarcina sp. UBA289 TaxID=1915574 RepID=UPI0025F6F2C3|nr:hypothetical protein [Methanosarcina sp. UBA289]